MNQPNFTREQVMAIPAPPRTTTWGVLSHADIIRAMVKGVDTAGIEIDSVNEHYQLTHNGQRLFAVWTFGTGAIIPAVGFRHSTDKSIAWGIAAGSHVYVCSNMCIDGTYVDFIVQRGNVDLQLAFDFATTTIATTLELSGKSVHWLKTLQHIGMNISQQKAFIYDVIDQGVLPFSKLDDFKVCVRQERNLAQAKKYGFDSLYVMHGAMIRQMKSLGFNSQQERARTLRDITEYYRN